MIRFFRQSYLIQYVVIALILIALWVPSFITGEVDMNYRSDVTPLYNLLANVLDFSRYAMIVFAFLLMAFEAVFFNAILASNQLITKVSTVGAVVFLLMMNLLPAQTTFTPFLLATVFILMFLHTVFSLYQTRDPEMYLLNAGIYLSLATMCYFPVIVLVVWGMVAFAIIHKGSFRLHLLPFIGFLFPYFIYFVVHFLVGDLMTVIQAYGNWFTEFHLTATHLSWPLYAIYGFLLLSVAMPLLMPRNYSFDKSVAFRLKMAMSIILILFGIFMLFVDPSPSSSGVFMLSLSILFSSELAYIDGLRWSSVTFIICILSVIALRYILLFV